VPKAPVGQPAGGSEARWRRRDRQGEGEAS